MDEDAAEIEAGDKDRVNPRYLGLLCQLAPHPRSSECRAAGDRAWTSS